MSIIDLPPDPLNEIGSYCNLAAVYFLRLTCQYLRDNVKRHQVVNRPFGKVVRVVHALENGGLDSVLYLYEFSADIFQSHFFFHINIDDLELMRWYIMTLGLANIADDALLAYLCRVIQNTKNDSCIKFLLSLSACEKLKHDIDVLVLLYQCRPTLFPN